MISWNPRELEGLVLSLGETVALEVIKLWLLQVDYMTKSNETDAETYLKSLVFRDNADPLASWIHGRALGAPAAWQELSSTVGEENAARLEQARNAETWRDLVADFELRERLSGCVRGRRQALLIAVDLSLFRPWSRADPILKFRKKGYESELARCVEDDLGGFVSIEDFKEVSETVRKSGHFLKRRQVSRRTKVGVTLSAGALGVMTGGALAAPIGAAFAPAGLGGAAAANAGLAVLGNGTLAAGGYGMAGGTLLIQATAAASAGALAAGAQSAGVRLASNLTGASSATYLAELAQLLTIVRWIALDHRSEDVELAEDILEFVKQAQLDHAALKTRMGGRTKAPDLDRKIRYLERARSEIETLINDHG